MSRLLDREGVFKAVPISWGLSKSDNSQSVALVIEFGITAQMEDDQWTDWTGFEDHSITGYFYIVKRDGGVNSVQVESLVKALGWDGSLLGLEAGPPHVTCQITVAEEEYAGKSRLKIQWINHKDFVPGPKTLPPGDVAQIDSQYGSLLRAAAAAAKPKGSPAEKPAPPPPPGKDEDDDLPFD